MRISKDIPSLIIELMHTSQKRQFKISTLIPILMKYFDEICPQFPLLDNSILTSFCVHANLLFLVCVDTFIPTDIPLAK
jgi:hypothetical protein